MTEKEYLLNIVNEIIWGWDDEVTLKPLRKILVVPKNKVVRHHGQERLVVEFEIEHHCKYLSVVLQGIRGPFDRYYISIYPSSPYFISIFRALCEDKKLITLSISATSTFR